jgi:dUTP pyrophosphatase
MVRVGKFEKVSFEQFSKDIKETFGDKYFDAQIKYTYYDIKLPKRATTGSAGNDFFTPFSFTLKPNETIKIPTGIRVFIEDGWVLKCYPRSGLGTKYRMQIDNSIPVIDSDYYFSDNEGHIFIKITNDTKDNKELSLDKGDAFIQGIYEMYGISYDDTANGIRNGGMGSTTKKNK